MRNNKNFNPRGFSIQQQSDIMSRKSRPRLDDRTRLFRRRNLEKYGLEGMLSEIADNIHIQTMLNTLDRGFVSRDVVVGTTPTLLIESPQPRGYLILNPTLTAGITTSVTLLTSSPRTSATIDTTASPVNVANFNTARLWLDITAVAGGTPTITINALTQDPVFNLWAESQGDIFGAPNSVSILYQSIGSLGIDSAFAIQSVIAGAGTITFSLSMLLKDGLPGTSTGVEPTVFLGATSGITTVSGFPLLAGNFEKWYMRENTPLYGIALVSSSIRIFELS